MRLKDLLSGDGVVKQFSRKNFFGRAFDDCADAVGAARSPDDFSCAVQDFKSDKGAAKRDAGRQTVPRKIFDVD